MRARLAAGSLACRSDGWLKSGAERPSDCLVFAFCIGIDWHLILRRDGDTESALRALGLRGHRLLAFRFAFTRRRTEGAGGFPISCAGVQGNPMILETFGGCFDHIWLEFVSIFQDESFGRLVGHTEFHKLDKSHRRLRFKGQVGKRLPHPNAIELLPCPIQASCLARFGREGFFQGPAA